MSEPKFTPGPWLVGRPHNEDVPSAINGWNYYPIFYGNDEEQVCDIVYNKADANLIAAAPEMYHFIENLVNQIEENGLMQYENANWVLNDAKELLREARGESEVES